MKSQVKWGIVLIAAGFLILPFGFPFLLIYSVPLVIIGAALILFSGREEIIEQIEDGGKGA